MSTVGNNEEALDSGAVAMHRGRGWRLEVNAAQTAVKLQPHRTGEEAQCFAVQNAVPTAAEMAAAIRRQGRRDLCANALFLLATVALCLVAIYAGHWMTTGPDVHQWAWAKATYIVLAPPAGICAISFATSRLFTPRKLVLAPSDGVPIPDPSSSG